MNLICQIQIIIHKYTNLSCQGSRTSYRYNYPQQRSHIVMFTWSRGRHRVRLITTNNFYSPATINNDNSVPFVFTFVRITHSRTFFFSRYCCLSGVHDTYPHEGCFVITLKYKVYTNAHRFIGLRAYSGKKKVTLFSGPSFEHKAIPAVTLGRVERV